MQALNHPDDGSSHVDAHGLADLLCTNVAWLTVNFLLSFRHFSLFSPSLSVSLSCCTALTSIADLHIESRRDNFPLSA
jgi:hypothetical protein